MRIVHLVVGPAEHGVVRHGLAVAAACGQPAVRCVSDIADADVVHVAFTDRLFGERAEDAAAGFAALADRIRAPLSVTLHDVPADETERDERRRTCYRSVVARCRGVVVNSWSELTAVAPLCDDVHSLRVIALPIEPADARVPTPKGRDVTVHGFVFPDRGYEQVLAALPPGSGLVALGRASDGHADLPGRLGALAAELGRGFRCTGFVADADLPAALATVAVPVAPNARVSASGSIATWLAHGRRPLVADSPHARELARRWPGAIAVYRPGELAGLIDAALADPSLTVLGEPIGSTLGDVAADYREHLGACAPPRPMPVRGKAVLPGNRWDLLDGVWPAQPPEVSVVIPYFAAQAQLDRVLDALAGQTHPPARLQVIVADDGSPTPPRVPAHVTLMRQDDRGFRAAAARNLGASGAEGEVLLFLDGDTVPEPDYVRQLSRLPALAHDIAVVGRRRHRDMRTGAELTEPQWLRDGYADDLRDVDARSYRFMISAVLGTTRELFEAVSGFADFVGYGGEDWELAHRLFCAGAVFAHVPQAVAWHDGPDWAGREVADGAAPKAAQKETERRALAPLVPDAELRRGEAHKRYPAVAISCAATLTLPGGLDARVWPGDVPPDVLARCRVLVELYPPDPRDSGDLAELCAQAERIGEVRTPYARIRASRAVARARRWPQAGPLFGLRSVS